MKLSHLLAVFLPFLVMVIWAGSRDYLSKTGPEVMLRITGYDPRDLLAGHYLVYRVDYGTENVCKPEDYSQERCVCLHPEADGFFKGSEAVECSAVDCPAYLRGRCLGSFFEAGIERFYISERHAPKLQVVPPDAAVRVRIGPTGRGLVTEMLVEGEPLERFLERTP